MRIEDVVLVAAVREDVRKSIFRQMGTAEVTQVVQAALAGKLATSRAAKQITSTATASLVGSNQEDGGQNSGDKFSVSSGPVGLRRRSLANV